MSLAPHLHTSHGGLPEINAPRLPFANRELWEGQQKVRVTSGLWPNGCVAEEITDGARLSAP